MEQREIKFRAWADEEFLIGEEALKYMKYSIYVDELKRRELQFNQNQNE